MGLVSISGVHAKRPIGLDRHPKRSDRSSSPEEAELMRNYRACSPQWRHTISMTARAAAGESREETERAAYADAVSEAV